MWPFKKKEGELQELRVPFQEPKTYERMSEPVFTSQTEKQELILSKLDTIIAKLDSIEQRLKNLGK